LYDYSTEDIMPSLYMNPVGGDIASILSPWDESEDGMSDTELMMTQ